jgi:hypothetical protein
MQFESKSCLNVDIFACREPAVRAAITPFSGLPGPGHPFIYCGLSGDAE